MHLLSWLISIPLIASLIAFIIPIYSSKLFKMLAVVAGFIPLGLLLYGGGNWIGQDINVPWMPAIHVDFHLHVDELSLIFLYLTSIVVPFSLLAVRAEKLTHPNIFYALVLLLEGLLVGFFTSKDLALFTFFWEALIIPLFFIIALWGGSNRQSASLKFLIYMVAGSALMVAAVLTVFLTAGSHSFNMDILAAAASSSTFATFAFIIFLLAFAVKTPLFPFHAWLPDAYYQASTPGTILLAGILSKAGIYGIFRIGLGFFPSHVIAWSPILLGLAIAGVLYGGLAAWRQSDFKRLIAYSSFSHVNFVLAGLFVWNQFSHEGAILQAVNHGITITALFLVAGWLEERLGTTAMGIHTGLAKYFPTLCWITLLFVLSSIALPSTNNFIGEILILFGLFNANPWLAAILGLSVILSVIYMLRFMQRIYFETPSQCMPDWSDLGIKEWAIAFPLAVLILGIGIYPLPLLQNIENAAEVFSIHSKEPQ